MPNRTVIQRPEGRDPQRHLVRGGKRVQVELGSELGLSFLQERPPGQPSAIVAMMLAYQSIYRAESTRLRMKIRNRS